MAVPGSVFNLLQFVALVTPAIAVVLEIIESRDGPGSFAMTLLEIALVGSFIGGLLLLAELIITSSRLLITLGASFVFVSLLLTSFVISWDSLSLSKIFAEVTGSSPSLFGIFTHTGKLAIVLIFAIISLPVEIYLITEYVPIIFDLGPLREIEPVSPFVLSTIMLTVLFMRSIIFSFRSGNIPVTDLQNAVTQSLAGSLVIMWVLPIMGLLPTGLLYLVISYTSILSLESPIFLISYAWLLLLMLIILAAKLDQEE